MYLDNERVPLHIETDYTLYDSKADTNYQTNNDPLHPRNDTLNTLDEKDIYKSNPPN